MGADPVGDPAAAGQVEACARRRQGQRKLSKRGDPELRRLSYMAAKTFARHDLGRALYERYRQRGLSAIATYVILARKILRLAHALITKDTVFDADRFATACART